MVLLSLVLALPAHAHAPVDPDAIAHAMAAFVTAGGSAEDAAFVEAQQALARCRADLAAGRTADARRRCALAEAAFALSRERALLALARARAQPGPAR